MKNEHKFQINEAATGRLDRALAFFLPDYSRTFLQNLIKENAVSVDGNIVTQPRFAVKPPMTIHITIPETRDMTVINAENFEFDILIPDKIFYTLDLTPAHI